MVSLQATRRLATARSSHSFLRKTTRAQRSFTTSPHIRDKGSKIDSLPATFGRVTLIGASLGWVVAGLMYFYSPSTVHTSHGQDTKEKFLRDWDQKRRKEGDLEVEETEEQRQQEKDYRESHKGQPKGNVR